MTVPVINLTLLNTAASHFLGRWGTAYRGIPEVLIGRSQSCGLVRCDLALSFSGAAIRARNLRYSDKRFLAPVSLDG